MLSKTNDADCGTEGQGVPDHRVFSIGRALQLSAPRRPPFRGGESLMQGNDSGQQSDGLCLQRKKGGGGPNPNTYPSE